MSRYAGGRSSGRDNLSPFASQTNSQGDPLVTDEDFSYITSEDLEHSLQAPAHAYDTKSRQPPQSANAEDDVLLIKSKGVTYPVHFPAYSISDGKLSVRDVRDRIGLVMEIHERDRRRIKMLYKGKQLKDSGAPIREYGVKNNSEILGVIPEGKLSDEESDESSEEVIVTDSREDQQKSKKKRNKRKKKVRSPRGDSANPTSGDDSGVPSSAIPPGAMEKLASISSHFNTKMLPICLEFSANPPKDKKKCEDEHRKISETIMQQVLLKLDEVNTGGDPDLRAKRKLLVNQVQDVLKGLDESLPEGSTRPTY